ncbi:MAG: hypothetical protein RIF46_12385, partial [Cyclobacteriaceae bacterium]
MRKLTYILFLTVIAFSCNRDDIIEGTAVSFYPTVIASGAEQDGNSYVLNLETSQFISGTAEVTIELEMSSEGVLETTPALDGNRLTVDFSNTKTAQVFVTIGNDAIPDDYTAIFRIVSASNGIQPSRTNKYTLNVRDTDSVPIFSEDFNNCPILENFTAISVVGDQLWACTDFGFDGMGFRINGYSGGAQDNEDWLVSDQINLLGRTNVSASFYSDMAFGGPELEVRVSTDYDGAGDPTSANWTTLDAIYDENTEFDNWTHSGTISLNQYISET